MSAQVEPAVWETVLKVDFIFVAIFLFRYMIDIYVQIILLITNFGE